jgi:hypothetical protein
MVSPNRLVSPSKMIDSLFGEKKKSPTKRTKSSVDAQILCEMFDSKAYNATSRGNGITSTGLSKGLTYLGRYTFLGLPNGAEFNKTTPRFTIDSNIAYQAERSFILLNNVNATDVPMNELENFIFESSLILRPYIKGEFMCGDFAARLHNNAEAHGIRCGFVVVSDVKGNSHAINVFCGINSNGSKTIVFVDMTYKTHTVMNETEFKKKEVKKLVTMSLFL